MRPPAFWQHGANPGLSSLLSPLASVVSAATARRVARPGWHAPVPVICCGNLTVGGAGKTTLALDLGRRLIAHGRTPHFLTRGYRGSAHGPHRVSPGDPAALVGDEGLLLAEVAPAWVGADRAASAQEAVRAGADILVLDDGLQNPSLCKDLSLLVIDGTSGFGNARVLPAGPLREPIEDGAARCHAAILIGPDPTGAAQALPSGLPVLRAALSPGPEIRALIGREVTAVAGIARPEKFFSMLRQAGVVVVETKPFPDHHQFTPRELACFRASRTPLATTPKDAARLSSVDRALFTVVGVALQWADPAQIERLILHPGES